MTMTRKLLLIVGATALLSSPVAKADDVHLVNGQVYEGVVAEEVPGGLRIHLPFGRITIPHHQVLKVVEAPSAVEELVHRRQRLEEDRQATGKQWLSLAQWAHHQGLEHAAREAALAASRLEPELPGLAAILEPAGFVLDQQRQRWTSESEYMARHGFVRSEGRWIPAEIYRELVRDAQERRRVAAETALLEAQRAQVERETLAPAREQEVAASHSTQPFLFPWASPTVIVVPSHSSSRARPPFVRPSGHGYDALIDRVPGSLIGVGRGTPPGTGGSRD